MDVTITAPALVMVIGLLLYWFSAPTKPMEVGRIMFFCGLLALLIGVGAGNLRLG